MHVYRATHGCVGQQLLEREARTFWWTRRLGEGGQKRCSPGKSARSSDHGNDSAIAQLNKTITQPKEQGQGDPGGTQEGLPQPLPLPPTPCSLDWTPQPPLYSLHPLLAPTASTATIDDPILSRVINTLSELAWISEARRGTRPDVLSWGQPQQWPLHWNTCWLTTTTPSAFARAALPSTKKPPTRSLGQSPG